MLTSYDRGLARAKYVLSTWQDTGHATEDIARLKLKQTWTKELEDNQTELAKDETSQRWKDQVEFMQGHLAAL